MRCENCKPRSDERLRRPPRARRGLVWTCERCGAPIGTLPGTATTAGDGTRARLTRFGLAITGEPLLERKREGP
jgi:hypothetical protein